MNRVLNKPQLYGVALRAEGCYNSGYLRFIENDKGNCCIDGILTDNYFRFDYGECEDGTNLIVLTILEAKNQCKHYVLVDLDATQFVLETGVYNLGVSITDPDDVIYFTLLTPIENTTLENSIISAIDVAQSSRE